MNSNFRYQLEERLVYSKEWAINFSNKLKHFELTDRVERELNKQKPFTSSIRRIYYLPLNILKYYKKKQLINEYEWTLKEIEILEKELKNFQK